MIERLRRTMIIGALVLGASSPSQAGPPSRALSTVPARITLVGSTGGVADLAAGQFTIEVRDLGNNPEQSVVILDLAGCEDVTLCSDQLDAEAIVNCTAKTMSKFTDVNGLVTFTVLGASNGAGNATTLLSGGRVYANGVLIGDPSIAVLDLDGSSGVGANDLSAWFTDFGTGIPYGRSDYDGSGEIGANDLAVWFSAFAAAGSAISCATSCP